MSPRHLPQPLNLTVSRVAAAVAMLTGVLVLYGWGLDIDILKSMVPGLVAVNPVAAVEFILLGAALWLYLSPAITWRRHATDGISALVVLVGLLKLAEPIIGWHTGIDQLFFRRAMELVVVGRPNRMALNTAFNFVLLGLAIALGDTKIRERHPAQLLLIVSAIGVLLPVVGYLYMVRSLYVVGSSIPMALPSALTFLTLCIGCAFARPTRGLARLFNDPGVAGLPVRRLLPAAILIPVSLGLANLLGQRLRWFDAELGMALLIVTHVLIFGALVVWSGRQLGRSDRVRAEREDELLKANASLREEVSTRNRIQASLDTVVRRDLAAVRNARDLICSVDVDGRFAMVNPACLSLLGYHPEELIGRPYIELIADDDVQETTAQALRIMAGLDASQFENRARHKSGRLVYLIWSGSWSPHEQMMFCVARDNTDHKRAAAVLQASRNYLDRIINAVADPIFVTDRQHRRVLVNDAYCQLVGRDREQLINKTDFELFPMLEAEAFSKTDEMVFATGREELNEETFAAADATVRIILTRKRLHIDDHERPFIVGVIRDVTEDRQREMEMRAARDLALESVRLKAEFLANMSHEIRTPMIGVIGMTDLLLGTDLSARQQEYAETIQSSADALLTIINDILDFSKFEAGRLHFETIDFDLREVVEAPVELLADTARTKGLELASLVRADVPTALRGDPGRLRQVLTNLIGNAIKFTNQGEVVVTVHLQGETDREVTLRLEVRDTGIGISPEAAQRLFRPFTQGDGTTTRRFGGTGLGLAISKQIVGMMGGDVGIISAPEAGSTFWFTVTLEKQLAKDSRPGDRSDDGLTGRRVLIVDDNQSHRANLSHQTTSWGMIAAQAASGVETLALLHEAVAQHRPYDIALVDLVMPEQDGWQLAQAIKRDQMIAGVRVVLLSSVEREHEEASARAVVAAWLAKPVRQSQLHDCLRAVMAQGVTGDAVAGPSVLRQPPERVHDHSATIETLTTVRILLADDVLINQKVALSQLRKLGYQADAVANGFEAVQALAHRRYDLVLMDCQMPEMDGYVATAEIRRWEGTAQHTPIIAMTASALDGDRERCLAAGMDDYLSKPVKPDALREMLGRWLAVR